jgi:hypothetical protein
VTYACPSGEFTADTDLFNLQRLQDNVLSKTINLPRRTPTRELHVEFERPYVYEFITKLHWQQAEVTKNQENNYVGNNGQ